MLFGGSGGARDAAKVSNELIARDADLGESSGGGGGNSELVCTSIL